MTSQRRQPNGTDAVVRTTASHRTAPKKKSSHTLLPRSDTSSTNTPSPSCGTCRQLCAGLLFSCSPSQGWVLFKCNLKAWTAFAPLAHGFGLTAYSIHFLRDENPSPSKLSPRQLLLTPAFSATVLALENANVTKG